MKIYIDRQKVNSKAALANAASVGGLLLLLATVLAPLFFPALAGFTLVLLFLGGAISMVGIYLANRWVRRPRPEESLDHALKAFDDTYRLYHYPSMPCDHVLLTPNGIVGMEVVNLASSFTYREGRWKEAMTIGRALRYLVEPRVGDPVELAEGLTDAIRSWLTDQLQARANVPIRVLTVFTHPSVDLEIDRGGVPAYKIDKLRKNAVIPGARLPGDLFEQVASALERATLG